MTNLGRLSGAGCTFLPDRVRDDGQPCRCGPMPGDDCQCRCTSCPLPRKHPRHTIPAGTDDAQAEQHRRTGDNR